MKVHHQITIREFEEWILKNPDANRVRKYAIFNSIADCNYREALRKKKDEKRFISRV